MALRLREPWDHMRPWMGVSALTGLHPFTKLALSLVIHGPALHSSAFAKLHLYPDGACKGDLPSSSTTCGWGVAIVAELTSGSFAFLGGLSGPVVLHGPAHIGAQSLSSFSAEVSAFAWAIAWALQANVDAVVPIYFLPDNTSVGDLPPGG